MSDKDNSTPEEKPEELRGLPPGLEPPPGIEPRKPPAAEREEPDGETPAPKRKGLSLRPREKKGEGPTILPPDLAKALAGDSDAPRRPVVQDPAEEPQTPQLKPAEGEAQPQPTPSTESSRQPTAQAKRLQIGKKPKPEGDSEPPKITTPILDTPDDSADDAAPSPAPAPRIQPPAAQPMETAEPTAEPEEAAEAPPQLQVPSQETAPDVEEATPAPVAPSIGLASKKKNPPPLPGDEGGEADGQATDGQAQFPPGMGPPQDKAPAPGSAAAQQEAMRAKSEKIMRAIKLLFMAACFMVLLVGAYFVYKIWLHPHARIAWEIPGDGNGPSEIYKATDTVLIAKVGQEFIKLNPTDGAVAWRVDTGQPEWGTIDFNDQGIILYKNGQMQRLSEAGQKLWTIEFSEDKQRLLTYNEHGALFLKGHRLKTLEYLNWQVKQGRYTRDELFGDNGIYGSWGFENDDVPSEWMNEELIAYSMRTGKQIWTIPAKDDIAFHTFDIGPAYCVGAMTKQVPIRRLPNPKGNRTHAWEAQTRLVILDASTGSLYERVKLPETPHWGPALEDGKIVFSTFTESLTLNRAGRVVDKGVPRQRDWDHEERETHRPRGSRDPAVQSTGKGIAYVDPKTGNETWTFALDGNILSFDATDEVVVVTGHATEKGAEGDAIAQSASQALGGDETSGLIANAVSVNDYVLVGLDKATGEKLWEKEKITGEILCDAERVVLIQDTAKTSPTIRANNGRGELLIHQFKPRSGGNIYTKKHKDLAIRDPRILNDQLVGLAYDREESKLNPSRRGNCTGIVALNLK